ARIHPFLYPLPTTTRDLHPFPTRRSSDLKGKRRSSPVRVPALGAPSRLRSDTPARTFASITSRAQTMRRRWSMSKRDGAPNAGTDRKSTRLNSSHVAISYAVFCLKKKKQG